jgi:hypothetical protein
MALAPEYGRQNNRNVRGAAISALPANEQKIGSGGRLRRLVISLEKHFVLLSGVHPWPEPWPDLSPKRTDGLLK